MDMELDKRTLTVYETVLDTSAIHDENAEVIVPDASPDIERIICSAGQVYIKEKNPQDGRVDISGIVKGCVLYMPESDENMRRIEVTIPFNHRFESANISNKANVIVTAWIQSMEAREINPRKISVRVNIGVTIKAYEQTELEICTGFADADKYALETKRQRVNIYAPMSIKEKSFTITDDVELPPSKPQLVSAITCNAQLNVTDIKIIGNKAVVKGNAYVYYLYQTKDAGIAGCEHELPFSQIIDIDGVSEESRLDIKLCIRGIEMEPQHDLSGDVRFVSMSILVDGCVLVYCDDEIETLEDAYSTKYDLRCEFESKAFPRYVEHLSKRIAVTESLETASKITSVIDLNIHVEPAVKRKEEGGESIANEMLIELIYLGEDDEIYCASRRCSAVCPIGEASDFNYDAKVRISGKNYSVAGENEVVVRCFAEYEADVIATEKTVVVSNASVDAENNKDTIASPSVIIKYINTDQPLWDTAKKFNTTVQEIAAANALEDEEIIRAGSMLLIPKVR